MTRRTAVVLILHLLLFLFVFIPTSASASNGNPGNTTRASETESGIPSDYGTFQASISQNGRYVVFASYSPNLIPPETSPSPGYYHPQIYMKDMATKDLTLVSVGIDGKLADQYSDAPSVSTDGRFVAFVSAATNLGPDPPCEPEFEGCTQIYVRDLTTRQTQRVSVSTSGQKANFGAYSPTISANGRYVVFGSTASNLVSGDSNVCSYYQAPGSCPDVFVRDLQLGETTLISVSSLQVQGDNQSGNIFNYSSYYYSSSKALAISADGRFVSFPSMASNLVPGDTNTCFYSGFEKENCPDVFVRDQLAGTTERISVSDSEVQGSQASFTGGISEDGRYATFVSASPEFSTPTIPGPIHQVFVRDRNLGSTSLVSKSSSGNQATHGASGGSISKDGRYVAFSSYSSNLVPNDSNRSEDSFVHDRQTGTTTRASLKWDGTQLSAGSFDSSINGEGAHVVFISYASDAVKPDYYQQSPQVYVRYLGYEGPPANTAVMPEGATHSGFNTFLLLANPSPTELATVDVTLLTTSGPVSPPGLQGVMVAPQSRKTIHINNIAGAEEREFGIRAQSFGVPIVAEASVHKRGSLAAMNMQSAAAPATKWIIPEGATHSGFATFVSVVNPNAGEAVVDISFLTPTGLVSGPQNQSIPAGSRKTFELNPWVPSQDASTLITADSGSVVAGMTIHKVLKNAPWAEPDLAIGGSLGVTQTATAWVAAEGATHFFLSEGEFSTFVLIANPGPTPAEVDVTFLTKDVGAVNPVDLQGLDIPAFGRRTVAVDAYVPRDDVSTLVEATSGSVVVESSLQRAADGHYAIADSVAQSGSSVSDASGTLWLAAEGATHSSLNTFILIANADVNNIATVDVRFLTQGSGLVAPVALQDLNVPRGGRITVSVDNFVEADDVSTLVEASAGKVVVEMSLHGCICFLPGSFIARSPAVRLTP